MHSNEVCCSGLTFCIYFNLISLSPPSRPFSFGSASHSHLTCTTPSSHSHRALISLSSHSHLALISFSSHSHLTRVPLPSRSYLILISVSSHSHLTLIAFSFRSHLIMGYYFIFWVCVGNNTNSKHPYSRGLRQSTNPLIGWRYSASMLGSTWVILGPDRGHLGTTLGPIWPTRRPA
jgi:hypothetical protein